MEIFFRTPVQSRSCRCLLLIPCCPPRLFLLPFSSWQGVGCSFVSYATFPFFWLVLAFSGTFSSKFSIYSQYFYCFLSFSSPVFSLHAYLPHFIPFPLSSPHKQRTKATVNKTCKKVSSDDLHFTWAPPPSKWKGILF